MSIRTWMFLASVVMMLLGVGGLRAVHAQEPIDCPVPQAGAYPLEQNSSGPEELGYCPMPGPSIIEDCSNYRKDDLLVVCRQSRSIAQPDFTRECLADKHELHASSEDLLFDRPSRWAVCASAELLVNPQPHPTQRHLPDSVPEETPPITGGVPEDVLSPIVGSVAERTGADPKEIEVIRSQRVYWNDGSLGCPQPSMSYTQAPVDGYWVVLSYRGQEFDYWVNDKGFFSLCEGLTPPSTGFSILKIDFRSSFFDA
jgi:hypothetical protein